MSDPLTYYTFSQEDVDQNGAPDNWGATNVGFGLGEGQREDEQRVELERAVVALRGEVLTDVMDLPRSVARSIP